MAYDPVRLRTVAASLRRVALSRGLRRLVVVTGLAVLGSVEAKPKRGAILYDLRARLHKRQPGGTDPGAR